MLFRLFLVVIMLGICGLHAAQVAKPIIVQPSENQGRVGIYRAETDTDGYAYYVNATAYKPERPAGLYLFFHGQNGQNGAAHFGAVETQYLTPLNLIGINMCYADGDNARDSEGKVRAARVAVAQVIADYRIVVGRGVLASFSGGGIPHGIWWTQDGTKAGTADFPFTHMALHSSNFRAAVSDTSRTSWFISVGTEEWALANLGETQSRVATQAYQCLARKGSLDIDFMISGKGHTIPAEEIARSAGNFARSDLALGPIFAAAAEAPTPAMRKYIDAANNRAIGATLAAVDAALAKRDIDADATAALTVIRNRLTDRIAAMSVCIEGLGQEDPILAAHYGQLFIALLGKHEAGKTMGRNLADLGKRAETQARARAYAAFVEVFPKLFTGAPSLDRAHKALLTDLIAVGPDNSLMVRMCREFTVLPARN